jgi:hypothetical protein
MKTLVIKGIAIFFLLLVATSLLMDLSKMEFGTIDFFKKHGIFFLVFITLFPRLTLLFSSVATGGVLWWLGFIFCPRILVAGLATVSYFHTNPILVTMSWLVALGGETMEKLGLGSSRNRFVFRTVRMGGRQPFETTKPNSDSHTIIAEDVIEAEFTKKN